MAELEVPADRRLAVHEILVKDIDGNPLVVHTKRKKGKLINTKPAWLLEAEQATARMEALLRGENPKAEEPEEKPEEEPEEPAEPPETVQDRARKKI